MSKKTHSKATKARHAAAGVQLVRDAATGEFVAATMSYATYVALAGTADRAEAAEEAADLAAVQAVRARIAAGTEEILPGAMVKRLGSGESRVRVWREHRGMTQAELAAAAGIVQVNISQIETGARAATVETLQRIARALGVTLDDVAPLPPE